MDGGGSLAISIDVLLVLWPKAVIIWFDPRVVNSPENCSRRRYLATIPVIDHVSVGVESEVIVVYNPYDS